MKKYTLIIIIIHYYATCLLSRVELCDIIKILATETVCVQLTVLMNAAILCICCSRMLCCVFIYSSFVFFFRV